MIKRFLLNLFIFPFLIAGCLFSDSDYEKKIIINKYLLTRKQVSDLFLNKPIIQKAYKDLRNHNVYIVLQLTNTGNNGAWGELGFNIDNMYKETVHIKMIGPGSDSAIIVLPYSGILNPTNIEKPEIRVFWKSLKSK